MAEIEAKIHIFSYDTHMSDLTKNNLEVPIHCF